MNVNQHLDCNKREKYLHFIMFCILNGMVDINSKGVKEHLKGKEFPVKYMRGLNNAKLIALHETVMMLLGKLKLTFAGELKINTHLITSISFNLHPDLKETEEINALMLFTDVDNYYFNMGEYVSLNELVDNPKAIVIPKASYLYGFMRYVNGKWKVFMVIKTDPNDPIWS